LRRQLKSRGSRRSISRRRLEALAAHLCEICAALASRRGGHGPHWVMVADIEVGPREEWSRRDVGGVGRGHRACDRVGHPKGRRQPAAFGAPIRRAGKVVALGIAGELEHGDLERR
jgi:hypothetical protein